MKSKILFSLVVFLLSTSVLYAALPTITGFSPSSGPVGTLITVTGTNLNNPTSVIVGGKPAIVVSSSATKMVVMVMPGAATGVESITNADGTLSASGNFKVTPPVYPVMKQLAKVTGYGSIGKALQGASVAVSADGNTAVVGGTYDNQYKGAVWVFTKTGTTWTQQTKLVGAGSEGNPFMGGSIAISADGNTIATGGSDDNNGRGAVWVFVRNNNTWTQQGNKLVGSGSTGSYEPGQGASVSISADGNTVISGGPNADGLVGAAWIFTRNGNTWTQAGNKLVGTGYQGTPNQGHAVALSADGKTAIVGGYYDNGHTGAVWIYNRSGNSWTQQGNKVTAGAGQFGSSVALNADGNTALIGATNYDEKGGAWVFKRSGATWLQQGDALVGTGENLQRPAQGASVALSADGNTAMIGAPEDNNGAGASWLFARDGDSWNQVGPKLLGTGGIKQSKQGWSVALTATGTMAIAGGFYDNDGVGAVWGFEASTTTVINQTTPLAGPAGTVVTITGSNLLAQTGISIGGKPAVIISNTHTKIVAMVMPGAATGIISISTGSGIINAGLFTVNPTPYPNQLQGGALVGTGSAGAGYQGYAVDVSADGKTAIVGGYTDNKNAGAAWIYVRNGSIWTQQGPKLVGTGAVGGAYQGIAVSLSGDGNTAIIGGGLDNSSTGAAWIFVRNGNTWTQQGSKLVATGAVGAATQGSSVDLSADGNTAVIGGPQDNNKNGAIWVFKRSGNTWAQQGAKLVGNTGEMAGTSVAISADGKTIITGGFGDFGNGKIGGAWVYTLNGNIWTQQGPRLTRADATGPYAGFGRSVAISADGNTAIVGGVGDNSFYGAAWIYTRSGGIWTQQGNKIIGTGGGGYQGFAVSLTADGNTALMGGMYVDNETGAAWIFTRNGNTWTQRGGKLNIPAGGFKRQGNSVALSADGKTAIVGAPDSHVYTGAAGILVAGSATPASIASFSPSSGPAGTLVTIMGANLNDPVSFTIGGKPAVIVLNTGTKLVGMVMPGAETGPISVNTWNGVAKASGNFTVSAKPYPGAQQGGPLVGTGNTGAAKQGHSAAISADGNTAIVGGIDDNAKQGTAWVFTRENGVWGQQGAKLTGTGTTGAATQGTSVAISADGNTAVIGGPADNNGHGAIWIFTRNGNTWSQQGGKLTAAGSGLLNLGAALAITADGNTIIAGAPAAGGWLGTVYVFKRTNNIWVQSTVIKAPFTLEESLSSASFGAAVAISADGTTILAGSPGYVSIEGAAWVFELNENIWTKQAMLRGSGTLLGGTTQGSSVALSADGNTAAVSGRNDGAGTGAVWIFKRTGATWQQQGQKLTGAQPGGNAGWSVSLSADGNTVAFGAPALASGQGATWIYTRNDETWMQQGGKLYNAGSQYKRQGNSVALSADGTTLITGAPLSNSNQGTAFVYTSNPAPLAQNIALNVETVVSATNVPMVAKALSPNGDGINDVLAISGIENFADNKLILMNGRGQKIFETANYGSTGQAFDGRSNITQMLQPPGTYFYMLEYRDSGVTKSQKGYIILKY